MPMETARGIIQIESGKNYYWRATRPEPAHSAGSHLRIRGGKEESRRGRGREREKGERKRESRSRRRGPRVVEGRKGTLGAGETVGEETAGREGGEMMVEVALEWRERPRHHDLGE